MISRLVRFVITLLWLGVLVTPSGAEWTVTPTPGPGVTYVWWAGCAPDDHGWGPFTSPDACREMLNSVAFYCERPTVRSYRMVKGRIVTRDDPNPDFVRIADVCKDALNGRLCSCQYLAVAATVPGLAAAPEPGDLRIAPKVP